MLHCISVSKNLAKDDKQCLISQSRGFSIRKVDFPFLNVKIFHFAKVQISRFVKYIFYISFRPISFRRVQ